MSQESNKTQCKICKEIKERILDGKFNSKDKRWKDGHGGLWNGLSCPLCTKKRVKEAMKRLRTGNVSTS